jgi:hypothetical protein
MSTLKNAFLSLLLVLPLVSNATTITSFSSLSGTSLPSSDFYTGTSGSVVLTSAGDDFFVDVWTVDVGAGDQADFAYTESPFAPFRDISAFQVNDLGHGFTGLTEGVYDFIVSGVSTGINGGVYQVGTSVVPLPAAVWLFGTALFGVLGISKRKHQL